MTVEQKVRYWGVRLGGGGKYVEHAKKGGYIAIGWERIKSLDWLAKEQDANKARSEFAKEYRNVYGGTEIQVGQGIGQVIKFVRAIREDDIVVVPDMARGRVLVGRVNSPYEYKADWGDGCLYSHRKNVEWIKEVKRDTIPIKLRTSLGSLLTVFSLDRRKQEIRTLIEGEGLLPDLGKKEIKEITGNELAKVILSRLFNLDPESFERFITHLLTLVGFESTTTRHIGDKGVDVIGTFNPEGLADITLKAQVKRVSGRIGNQDILMLRGTLGIDEHGVLITTGGFTKQALTEAEAEGRKPIALIDGQMLVDLILTHYDELDEEYKQLLQLGKREVPLRERFYTTVMKG